MTERVVIIVDDEPGIRNVWARQFQVSGYPQTHAVGTSAEVMGLLASLPADVRACTLVVLDVNLGPDDCDGCECGRRITKKWPEVRTFYVSGLMDYRNINERCPGFVPLIQKPVTMGELLHLVNHSFTVPPWQPPAMRHPGRRRNDPKPGDDHECNGTEG